MGIYWNDKDFIEAIKNNNTISDVLRVFDIPSNQGYYNKMFHEDVARLNVSTMHFVKSKQPANTWPLDQILVENSFYKGGSYYLKLRLFKEKLLKKECAECGQGPKWNDKKLSLHLDHVNGNPKDNRIENLRILCPNCHSQTETYCGSKKRKEKHTYKFVCKSCGGPKKTSQSTLCNNCSAKTKAKSKIDWPNSDILSSMIQDFGYEYTGKKLGVSGNAVKKHYQKFSG